MPKSEKEKDDDKSPMGIIILLFAIAIVILLVLTFIGRAFCPPCSYSARGAVNGNAANTANSNAVANAVALVNMANTPPANTGSFASGATAPIDSCSMFGGEPDLEDPGIMFDQHPLIEFCVTNCAQYQDAMNRAAAEDTALSAKIASDPDNALWEMRQQYYTIYLDALNFVAQDIGCF
jgi:hypothetical protein